MCEYIYIYIYIYIHIFIYEAGATPIMGVSLLKRDTSELIGRQTNRVACYGCKEADAWDGEEVQRVTLCFAENGSRARWRRMETLVSYLLCAMCMRRFFLHRHVESVKNAMQVSQHSISASRHQRRFCNTTSDAQH